MAGLQLDAADCRREHSDRIVLRLQLANQLFDTMPERDLFVSAGIDHRRVSAP